MDPVIAEICRNASTDVRADVLRRWQRYLRDVIQPKLDRLEALEPSATSEATRTTPG